MKQAFAYLRVSSKGQIDGDGFERQLLAIQAYAKDHDIEIAEVFEERGVTGTSEAMDRPAWVRLIGRIMDGGEEIILIERLDRLARSQGIQEYILLDLRKRGITLISTKEPDLDSDDPTRIMFRQIIGAVAQYEKSMIVLKMRGARERIRARGLRCEGDKPYGHHAKLPKEFEVLQKINQLRTVDKMTFSGIANVLNKEGIKPRRGIKWYASSVRSAIIRDTKSAMKWMDNVSH